MALTTSTITGRVPLPNDANPTAAEVTFVLTGYDTESNQVIPGSGKARFVLQADGTLPAGAKLWRNTSGLRGTSYRVLLSWSEVDRRGGATAKECDLGWVQVGTASSYTLPELLANPAGPAPGWYETVPKAVWEDILALSGRVLAIEANGWVTTPRIAGGAVAPASLSPAVLDMLNGAGYAGLWSPAVNFPAGSVAGQVWLVIAAGSRGGQAFTVGDRLVALVNGASATVYAGNWQRVQQIELTQNNQDLTAGRAMKAGDWGLGGLLIPDKPANELNLPTSFFRSNANGPDSSNWYVAHLSRLGNAQGAQIGIRDSGATAAARMAFRHRDGTGTWSDWVEAFTRRNIVGQVSQSAGVPTGAVIERGSNANGEFTRWAEGTQICWHGVGVSGTTTADGSLFTTAADQTWTFPAAFSVPPRVRHEGVRGDRVCGASGRAAPTLTTATYRPWAAGSVGGSITVESVAIGRWF